VLIDGVGVDGVQIAAEVDRVTRAALAAEDEGVERPL
jgi:hypothetical protein